MTKKRKSVPQKPAQPAKAVPAKRGRGVLWILAGLAVVVVIAIVALSGKGWGSSAGGVASASPDEQKYIGRLLPAGYQEPKVADLALYSEAVSMTDIKAADEGRALSVAVGDVTANKIVKFEYAKPGGRPLPLIAYVKSSGKLFVAVSFCPPCEGEGQRIEPDGTVTCESCGTKRNIESGVGLSGTCKLYPLDEVPATVAGGKIGIEKAVLDKWTPQPLDRKIGG